MSSENSNVIARLEEAGLGASWSARLMLSRHIFCPRSSLCICGFYMPYPEWGAYIHTYPGWTSFHPGRDVSPTLLSPWLLLQRTLTNKSPIDLLLRLSCLASSTRSSRINRTTLAKPLQQDVEAHQTLFARGRTCTDPTYTISTTDTMNSGPEPSQSRHHPRGARCALRNPADGISGHATRPVVRQSV